MKKIITLTFLVIQLCSAQFYHYKATLTSSKQEVSIGEVFEITYSLSEVEGYHYVAVWAPDFDLIGKDRWEGFIHSERDTANYFLVETEENRSVNDWERIYFGKPGVRTIQRNY